MMKNAEVKNVLIALFAGAAVMAAPVQAGTLGDAERMIESCLDYAASQKLTPLSVSVIDASGALVAFQRQDGASSASAEVALLKARTAARLNAPTALLGPVAASDAPTRDTFLMLQMTTIAGGVPFTAADGRAIGAVGVSGAAPEQDAECARRAVESLRATKK